MTEATIVKGTDISMVNRGRTKLERNTDQITTAVDALCDYDKLKHNFHV